MPTLHPPDHAIVFACSRADALRNGVLLHVTALARQEGFRWPVALTRPAWGDLTPTPADAARGQSLGSRLWDVLPVARAAIANPRRLGARRLDPACYPSR
ncbi:MAG: hypothetical protein IRY83_10330 [Chloroflexi bacterium]|nr:hypothetical protein [Chloroflexota bacterium]